MGVLKAVGTFAGMVSAVVVGNIIYDKYKERVLKKKVQDFKSKVSKVFKDTFE